MFLLRKLLEFINDSYATEYIVKDRSILSNVTEVKDGTICSVNKNNSANLNVIRVKF